MRKIKLFPFNPSYVRIQNTHIFINFDKNDLNFLNTIDVNCIRKIHVFLTHCNSISHSLQVLIEKFSDKSTHNISVTIHIPYGLRQLRGLLNEILLKKDMSGYRYQLMVRRVKRVSFWSRNQTFPFDFTVYYHKNHMNIYINSDDNKKNVGVEYPTFFYEGEESDIEGDKHGIFDTADMRVNPTEFKDQLIENFKATLDGKFNPFKTDEEIWEFIMQSGEWKIEEIEEVPDKKPSQETIDFAKNMNAASAAVSEAFNKPV